MTLRRAHLTNRREVIGLGILFLFSMLAVLHFSSTQRNRVVKLDNVLEKSRNEREQLEATVATQDKAIRDMERTISQLKGDINYQKCMSIVMSVGTIASGFYDIGNRVHYAWNNPPDH